MKGLILIMDGMGDRPIKELGNKTPLEAANTPNMDKMAEEGITGIMDSIAPGIIPGSDSLVTLHSDAISQLSMKI